MASRWTEGEDVFLVQYLDRGASAEVISSCDLTRSAQSIKDRAKFLKASGAWRQYELAAQHRFEALKLAGLLPKNDLARAMAQDIDRDFADRATEAKPRLVASGATP